MDGSLGERLGLAVGEQQAADMIEMRVIDEDVGDGVAVDALHVEVVEQESRGAARSQERVAGVEQHLAIAQVEVQDVVLECNGRVRLEVALERAAHHVARLVVGALHFEQQPTIGYHLGWPAPDLEVVHGRVSAETPTLPPRGIDVGEKQRQCCDCQ